MDGFLLINKPAGITSFGVVRVLKSVLKQKKIGHTGTLDPAATGLLLIGIGQGTKLIEFLLHSNKEYEAEITLGAVSDSYDQEGTISLNEGVESLSRDLIEDKLGDFVGEIMQVPPVYSALKIDGKRACDRVRAGETVTLKKRKIYIEDIKLISYEWPKLKILVRCGAGTYIRSLAHDLGEKLGVGGYLSALARTKLAGFELAEAVSFADFDPQRGGKFTFNNNWHVKIIPLEVVAQNWPVVQLSLQDYRDLIDGKKILIQEEYPENEPIAGFIDIDLKLILKYLKENQALKIWKRIL